MTARKPPPRRGDPLTDREIACLRLAAAGQTNDEIRQALYVSLKTVRNTLLRAYVKLGARSGIPQITRAHAVHLAHDLITAKEQAR